MNFLSNSSATFSRIAFKLYLDPSTECKRMVEHAHVQNMTRVAVLVLQSDFAPPCEKSVKESTEQLGMQYTVYEIPTDQTDFRTILTKMRAEGDEAVIALIYEENALAFFDQRAALAMTLPVYCSRSDCYTDKVLAARNNSAYERGYVFDIAVDKAFADRYRKEANPNAGDTEIQGAATGYDAVAYIYAIEKSCPMHEATCLTNITYTSKIRSNNFGSDRIQRTITDYKVFKDGKLVVMQ